MSQTSDRADEDKRGQKGAKKASKRTPEGNGGAESPSGISQSFGAALDAVTVAPDSEEAWDHLESIAETLQRPDEVAAAYREAIDRDLPREAWNKLARRAAQFHDEWFGDNPEAMHAVLSRILERDPEAQWAFERLCMVLTVGERWDDLLALYDRVLLRTADPQRRKQLLDDAAHAAKDFAHAPGRAVDYMLLQLELDRDNDKLAKGIERLLERQSRWDDLVELWHNRLPHLPPPEARATRLKIARALLEHVGSAAPALDELRAVVEESPGHVEACAELERLLAGESFAKTVRMEALGLLRTNYRAAARPSEAVAAVERALTFAEAPERIGLQREAGSRLAILGKDERALQHYAALLREEPTDADARRQLRQLARRSNLHAEHADALVDAAENADPAQAAALLVEAADLIRQKLGDPDRAVELYRRVVALSEADPAGALTAAHNLNELLGAAGRKHERLDVLERLADLEQSSLVRRAVLGDAGRLADQLEDPDRALRAWERRLAEDDRDLEALAAIIDVLEKRERWEPLTEALKRRADLAHASGAAGLGAQQRRADLVRLARIQAERLDASDLAIATWTELRREFGDEPDTIAALDQLLGAAGRFDELASVLDEAASTRRQGACSLLSRLGEVLRTRLDRHDDATRLFAQALAVDPRDPVAREGLRELCDDASCRGPASEALVTAYRETDEWRLLLGLLEVRLAATRDRVRSVEILREAARLQEQRAEDLEAALLLLARAFVIDPDAPSLEAELHRLGELTAESDGWGVVARALGDAAPTVNSAGRAAQLLQAQGRVLEDRLADAREAVAAYAAAAEQDPENLPIRRAIIRCSAQAGTWTEACKAAVDICRARGVVDHESIGSLSNAAAARDEVGALVAAFEAALTRTADMPGVLARELHAQCARWHRDELDDLPAAAAAARRAIEADASHLGTLELLAQIQRNFPEAKQGARPALCETLIAIDRMSDRNLDALAEASELAVSADADPAFVQETVSQLYRKSARLFAQADIIVGERPATECAKWALHQLLQMHTAAGRREDAIRTLVAAAELPLPRDQVLDLRLAAARLSRDTGDNARAIELLTRVVEERPHDLTLLRELGELCEMEGRVLELVSVRNRELALTDDPVRRLELRLSVSKLVGAVERQGGRAEALRANLDENPGHSATIDALTEVLEDKGRLDELANVLTEQAELLESRNENDRAAELWTSVAELAEDRFGDIPRAIAALERVVALQPSGETLDELARLHLQRDEPAAAAAVLSRRLGATEPGARVPVLLRLARAQIQAGKEPDAIVTLQTAFDEAPKSGDVRKLLIKLYRDHQEWEPLARTLAIAAEHITDADAIVAYAREAAEIWGDRLGQPELAVPVLERAHALRSDDKQIKARLAEGLRVAGRLDEARAVLEELTTSFGRRRSAERAEAHLQLARVAHAQGDDARATDELEVASGMDPTNPTILQTLASMARDAGQLERAERAYRSLLIQVKRTPPRTDGVRPGAEAPLQASGVLYELSRIASDRGDAEQAQELIESAMEALAERPSEGAAFAERLRSAGAFALLARVLDARLAGADSPRRRAEVLGELAELQEVHLRDLDKAFESRLDALRTDPASPEHHAHARELAERRGRLAEYVDAVEKQLDKSRRTNDAYVRVELLLRLGEAMEGPGGDLNRAAELIARAEELGVREVDVWRSAARVSGALGDTDKQMKYLQKLSTLGEEGTETRADALYRMAEVHLANEETIDKGIVALTDALDAAPRYERACRILQRATADGVQNPELTALYDRVARKTGDDQAILQAIERKAQLAETQPEEVREGVELALRMGATDRAEALMLRAIELAEGVLDADARIAWARQGMARLRHAAGDAPGAVKWLCAAMESSGDMQTLVPLAKEITAPAMQEGGDLTLAVRVYEALLQHEATAPDVWRPLAELYRKLGDLDRLSRLVDDTIDAIEDPEERNALRLELAQSLLGSGENESAAIELLRNILLESPDHPVAQPLLADVLERTGRDAELVELLRERLLGAQSRGDAAEIASAALVLAERQAATTPDEAVHTLRGALESAPDDARLLRRTLELLPEDVDHRDERAEILERLIGMESGEPAAELASMLAQLHADAEDEEGHLRALVLGYQRHPGSEELRARLEKAYESRGDYRGLAQMLVKAAEGEVDRAQRLVLLRQAATIHRELLSNPETAADILERAHSTTPEDPELALELASALASAGKVERATTLVTGLLDDDSVDVAVRLRLLATRADLRMTAGDIDGAVADLEAALPYDVEGLAGPLIDALDNVRLAAQQAGAVAREREATLRLCELAIMYGDREQARHLLTDWVERERKDVVALRQLRDLAAAEERWDAVAKLSARLVAVESGDSQVDAALQLAAACRAMGKPEEAKAGLEHARRKQPDNPEIRAELRAIYEAGEPTKELAKLVAQDAESETDPEKKLDLMRRAAELFVALDDTESALPYIRQVLELSPGDAAATVTLADAYLAMGQVDMADQILGDAIGDAKNKRSPTLALLMHRKARVAGARNDGQSQLALLQQAFAADKNNGVIAAELADLAEALEVWDLAVRVLRTITLLDGPCPISRTQAFLRQAQICFRRGDRQRAVLWARKAKHESPADEDVANFLAALGET
jgi:tetratricopeptide (TPR) repeat protein